MESEKIFEYLGVQKGNPNINCCASSEETLQNTNAVIISAEWDEFKEINFEERFVVMKEQARVFDGRNILDHQKLKVHCF